MKKLPEDSLRAPTSDFTFTNTVTNLEKKMLPSTLEYRIKKRRQWHIKTQKNTVSKDTTKTHKNS